MVCVIYDETAHWSKSSEGERSVFSPYWLGDLPLPKRLYLYQNKNVQLKDKSDRCEENFFRIGSRGRANWIKIED